MALSNLNGTDPWSGVAGSTGFDQYSAVVVSAYTAGSGPTLIRPVAGVAISGVIMSAGSTVSTEDNQVVTVWGNGAKVKLRAADSTMAAGDQCSITTAGYASTLAAGDYVIGQVVEGSSGATGRILGVLLSPIGTT